MFMLPVLAGICLFVIFYGRNHNVVRSMANTWISFTVIAWTSIELLGWFYIWTKVAVALLWTFVMVLCIIIIYKKKYYVSLKDFASAKNQIWKQYRQHWLVYTIVLCSVTLIAIAALLRSPDNGDSMTYHLSRIMHWIQNKSTRYYGAGTDIQNRYPSLAEYLVSQILILGANDRLANLFQLSAYLASGVFVYAIGRKIRISKRSAFFSMCVFWCIPMAIAQAFSTQTDNIAGFFLLVYIYFVLDFIQADKLKADKTGLLQGIRLAACVMFSYLCKPTICFAVLVFFVWMCVRRIRHKDSLQILIKYVIVGSITAVVLYFPLLAKNYDVLQRSAENISVSVEVQTEEQNQIQMSHANLSNALAPDNFNVVDALKKPTVFFMNCVQNIGRNSGSAYFTQWNRFMMKVVNKLGSILNYNVQTYTVYDGVQFWSLDYATSPAIMFIALLMIVLLIIRVSRPTEEQVMFAICAIMSFTLQCGLMGFTMARSRYLVGVMALLAVMAGIVIDGLRCNKQGKGALMIALLAVCSVGAVNTYHYQAKYTVDSFTGGRCHRYFMGYDVPEKAYEDMSSFINKNGFTKLAIDGNLIYEYALWKSVNGLERLECVNLQNSQYGQTYAALEDMDYQPECLVKKTEEEQVLGQIIECHGNVYECVWVEPPYDKRLDVYFGIYTLR